MAKNVWACHSQSCITARGGAIGGNILDFVAVMEHCTVPDAALFLNRSPEVTGPARLWQDRAVRPPTVAAANRVLGFRLSGIDAGHSYIASRGVSLATARRFGIGYYPGPGFLSGRVVIPIHNRNGDLIAYAGRSIGEEQPKYKLPPGFRKSGEFFNLHRAATGPRRPVIVVEGFFDCMKVHQAGFANVVALMGCSVSSQQADLLTRHFSDAVLLLDGDEAGEHATAAIAAAVSGSMDVYRGRVPAGRQPDELPDDELWDVIERAIRIP